MHSLPPCDAPASLNGAGICAIGSAITAAGLPHTSNGTSKIVVLLDNFINTFDGVVT
jgi:hypothetical protein